MEEKPFGCKRCGYCCIYLDVVIQRMMPDGTKRYYHKPCDHRCPHLTFDGKTAACAIHDEPDYKECPCDRHNNPEYDPDIWHWGSDWRCIGPKLVVQKIYELRPVKEITWEELLELGD